MGNLDTVETVRPLGGGITRCFELNSGTTAKSAEASESASTAADASIAKSVEEPNVDLEFPEGETEEARKPVGLPNPRLPSRQEVEEHELTHLPHRSWCSNCVRGTCTNKYHRAVDRSGDPPAVPRVSMDDCFPNRDNAATMRKMNR